MKSRAMILKEFGKPLEMGEIEVPEAKKQSVVIRVNGAGVCRTDLRLWKGTEPRPGFKLPFVLGHENAGTVVEVGEDVKGLKRGDKVIVYAVWGDLTCKYCRQGKYMLCRNQAIPGQSYYYGGFSEYLYIPNFMFLYKINVDPILAAPLADAGLTSYSAVKKALKYAKADSSIILYGFGGLGIYALQIIKALAPYLKVYVVTRSKEKLNLIEELGGIGMRPEELNVKDVSVAIDFVGNEESTMRIAKTLESNGVIIEVGMEGDKLSIPTFESVVWEYKLVGSNYGTFNELGELMSLVERNLIKPFVIKRSLEELNEALRDLESGKVLGRQVVIP
ncbi:alcohol dehydrogenase [Sulfolobus sp. A20]|uniref:NAD(P)-dependent alcohol dehydrogenase n=1 Tax=Sulfolobaceae TaxID=118883 RepID=UPI00084613C7|nr:MULTISPECIES: NAD(P)-dependent alcohol dehydrogenase [unclassified Sulfolobus]TRM74525.1 NAD(P)-dependent alcohol dehydrogenase [Sulfolobus sp. E5]TRM75750.1 NAD(P)-dependent alcohol dehydrogenase [Sulfolobus sp. A20-N-F8]TRM76162.1 NAD(P)-dependent alcohol dehydrogenase [Sulfolobus sp. B5]TRM81641.1 NAD(P)-dependent alcohol dehydrogenase [Sulfolobus sp. D5]TRM85468.1 NAD(P)-dependent alcohol dehydrogenase [Sulfolobus sp. F3]TRM89514.1 NAD(P)-dependent alcohol dehydrogenase [Sulfolobus sp.